MTRIDPAPASLAAMWPEASGCVYCTAVLAVAVEAVAGSPPSADLVAAVCQVVALVGACDHRVLQRGLGDMDPTPLDRELRAAHGR